MPDQRAPEQPTAEPPDRPRAPEAPEPPLVDPASPTPAPRTPPADATASGRARLRGALLRPSRQQVVVAVLLATVGFAATVQVRAGQADDAYASYREQDLIDVLNGLADTSQRAQAEISRLESTKEDLQSSSEARQAALTQARTEADVLEILAGTVPVTGPGIRITVEEQEGQVDIDSLLDTVQELRTAGAEAMQVNGRVRVVASTSFEDGVGGVYVDDVLLEPPYVIDVIGEPSTLHGGMTFREGPIDQLEGDGATVTVEELGSLDIKSVTGGARSDFAQPVAPQ